MVSRADTPLPAHLAVLGVVVCWQREPLRAGGGTATGRYLAAVGADSDEELQQDLRRQLGGQVRMAGEHLTAVRRLPGQDGVQVLGDHVVHMRLACGRMLGGAQGSLRLCRNRLAV
jgi:hypothetical protein